MSPVSIATGVAEIPRPNLRVRAMEEKPAVEHSAPSACLDVQPCSARPVCQLTILISVRWRAPCCQERGRN